MAPLEVRKKHAGRQGAAHIRIKSVKTGEYLICERGDLGRNKVFTWRGPLWDRMPGLSDWFMRCVELGATSTNIFGRCTNYSNLYGAGYLRSDKDEFYNADKRRLVYVERKDGASEKDWEIIPL